MCSIMLLYSIIKLKYKMMQIAGQFNDATMDDIKKANSQKDVCCICLSGMKLARVKKMMCNHLLHTKCICEVVEKAKSIQAALCPLCRVSGVGMILSTFFYMYIQPMYLIHIICLGTHGKNTSQVCR